MTLKADVKRFVKAYDSYYRAKDNLAEATDALKAHIIGYEREIFHDGLLIVIPGKSRPDDIRVREVGEVK